MRDKNVEYMMNDAATVIAFVQEGDLWSYSPGNEKVNQVFSFRKSKDGDFRDSRTQHDIKIVRVTDEGDIDFVLYGYMNRGSQKDMKELQFTITIVIKTWQKKEPLSLFRNHLNF